MVIVLSKENNEPYECKDEETLITKLYSPLSTRYQQNSDLLESMIKMYANDVRKYDRAVGSKTFNKRLRAEFASKFKAEDVGIIGLINKFHPELMVKAG